MAHLKDKAFSYAEIILSKANQIGSGIYTDYFASGLSRPLGVVASLACKHMRIFLRLVLIAYAALTLYNLFYLDPLEFFSPGRHVLTTRRLILVTFQLVVIAFGFYGEFCCCRKATRIFIILVGFNGMSVFITVMLVYPVNIMQFSQRPLLENMWDAQKNYQWTLNGIAPGPGHQYDDHRAISYGPTYHLLRDTHAWDSMQSLGCCGIDGYDDWNRVRPAYMPLGSLPDSCCPRGLVTQEPASGSLQCSVGNSFRLGCRRLYENLECQRLKIHLLIGLMEIIIAVLFYMIEHQTSPDNPSPRLITNHNSLVNMHNAMRNPQPTYGSYMINPPAPRYNQSGNRHPDTVYVDEHTPYKSSSFPSGNKHPDTVYVDENVPYKSSP